MTATALECVCRVMERVPEGLEQFLFQSAAGGMTSIRIHITVHYTWTIDRWLDKLDIEPATYFRFQYFDIRVIDCELCFLFYFSSSTKNDRRDSCPSSH